MYHNDRQASIPPHARNESTADLPHITAMAANYFWAGYATLNGSYVAIATVFLIVLLSFLLPDLSQKIHRTNELKSMKEVLQMMSKQVSRAEVACLTVADKISCLHCSLHDDTTETIMDQRDLSMCTSGCVRTTQSEPVQMEKKISFFKRILFPKKNTSHKEVTIMSYFYTDSFDADKRLKDSKNVSEYTID